jgi:predicted GNAT superfamily acetyltransferase
MSRASPPAVPIHIRHLRTHAEFVACVDLQRETWGADFKELVPATILKVSQRLGGVSAGAFTDDDRLAGFVFGMTGVERGRVVHWSDMLAVREELRDLGVGRRLKEFQRAAALDAGATVMYWTYDPLVSRNAHLNFNKLGVRVAEYVEDMYGSTSSHLHRGIGTDRLIVAWALAAGDGGAPRAGSAPALEPGGDSGPILNPGTNDGGGPPPHVAAASRPHVVRVEIPSDIAGVQAESIEHAARWRATTRVAFQWALSHGYQVASFYHDAAAARGYYVLTRTPPAVPRSPEA